MHGPVPKRRDLLQRRNRTSTRASLPSEATAAKRKVPALPPRERGTEKWHPLVLRWWHAVWTSPMAEEYLESDKDDLYLLAELRQDFYAAADALERQKLAAEIRQQSVRFGLSPIDRRRLQWEVEKAEQATERTSRRRGLRAVEGKDPRDVLKRVS
ncbi:MAG TPA: hypothetical protein VNG95_06685 [Gemmatimonadales bacterium]|nr:hypothetical protein [Gemmatimonadales bacterium]